MAKMLATIRIRNSRGFMFEGERYHFLFHRYNCTWINERQVEVPVLRRSARGVRHDEVLEVGNVLSHYGRVRHRVVDKYERARGVSNEDFLHHRPPNPYRLILSISTFEHIGWDEADRDPRKFLLAVRHAQGLLAPGGLLALTVPLGYNPEVDRFVASPPDGFKVRFLERFGPLPGHWRQADRCTGETHPYDPAGKASGIAVILHRAPAGRR
ncbi:MAG TPA: hypothetical protein VM327_09125 [Candidatus Thermoplasmatota archaeon]|nr:hypothetical protein [Candidatus Thermoplasmatota archaeon]